MMRFPYHFDRGGPTTRQGVPVFYSSTLQFTANTGITFGAGVAGDRWGRYSPTLLVIHGEQTTAYTNDPDFEWLFYLDECHEQARRIVRDGLRARLPWLRDEAA